MKIIRVIFTLIVSLMMTGMNAQQPDNKSALLIIDIQDFYFPGGDLPLVGPEEAARKAATLLEYFREEKLPVVYVRHNYEPGGSINKIVAPKEGEKIFTKNEVNSFLGTGLDEYLKSLGIEELIICGMQTHMCLEGGARAASDLGYKVTVIHDACATRDLTFGDKTVKAEDVHYSTLSTLKSYARVVSAEEYLKEK